VAAITQALTQRTLDQRVFDLETRSQGLNQRVYEIDQVAKALIQDVESIKRSEETIVATLQRMEEAMSRQTQDTAQAVLERITPEITSLKEFVLQKGRDDQEFLTRRFGSIDEQLRTLQSRHT